MTMKIIPISLVAISAIIAVTALLSVQEASTVHTTIGVLQTSITADAGQVIGGAGANVDVIADSALIKEGTVCLIAVDNPDDDDIILEVEINVAGTSMTLDGNAETGDCFDFSGFRVKVTGATDVGDLAHFTAVYKEKAP